MLFYTVAVPVVKVIAKIFFPYKVHGNANDIPADKGVVLCANHVSFFDAVFLALVFKRQIRFIGKKKYAEMFFLKTIFKLIGAFGIDTEKPDLTALKNCFKVIKNGEVLGIFPEGTRVRAGKVSNPMPGTIMIAHKTKAPIFYVKIKPKHGEFKTFCRTDIYIGETLYVEDLGVTDGKGTQYKDAAIELVNKIYSLGD